jgi:hypothetical protein
MLLLSTRFRRGWADVFRELDQLDAVETFAERHAHALDARAGFRRFCSPKIGHLLAHDYGGFQIVHHVHQDGADDIDDDDEGDIWALMGAGGTAATVVLSSTGTYNKQTGVKRKATVLASTVVDHTLPLLSSVRQPKFL